MTCECEIVYQDAGSAHNDYIRYCPLHDGSMEKRLAEALKEAGKAVCDRYCPTTSHHVPQCIGYRQLLADYEAKAGK